MGRARTDGDEEILTEYDLGEDEDEEVEGEGDEAKAIRKMLREDAEMSKGEFTDDVSMQRAYQDSVQRGITKGIRRRRKSALKAEKRMGGPPKIWYEEENRRKAMNKVVGGTKGGKGNLKLVKKDDKTKDAPKKHDDEPPKKAAKKAPEKEVKGKKVKEAKGKETKGKEAKEKKAKRETKDRGPSVVDGKITLLAKENPKREGSNAYKKFELYKKHKTIKAYLEAGGKRSSLRYDSKKGYIKLSNLKHKGDEAA